MDKSLRYWGEFRSKNGILWRTEIWQNGEWTVENRMTFPQENPLEIEWSAVDKIDSLQPSNATLTVVSDTDRQYLNLYTLEAGSILLKVFRNCEEALGSEVPAPVTHLYWSGTLDPELYEEPFSEKKDYEVSLTFSDFAILDRLNYDRGDHFFRLDELIYHCLIATQTDILTGTPNKANYLEKVHKYVSIQKGDGFGYNIFLYDYIMGENFIDDQGTSSTLKEVLEGILQPYALRLVQRAGAFYLYDLNSVYLNAKQTPVVWAGTDATLAMDDVYNNAKLTFSPYGVTEIMNPEIKVKLNSTNTGSSVINTSYGGSDNYQDFEFNVYEGGSGVEIGEDARFFRMVPRVGGEECTGVLWTYLKGDYGSDQMDLYPVSLKWFPNEDNHKYAGWPSQGPPVLPKEWPVVFRAESSYIAPKGEEEYPMSSCLRLTLPLLFDARYNPFSDASSYNESGNYEYLKNNCNYLYVKTDLEVVDGDETLCYYNNSKNRAKSPINGLWDLYDGEWIEGKPSRRGNLDIAYYNSAKEHSDNTGIGGWVKNRQTCYPTYLPFPNRITARGNEGEYIPVPPKRGRLRLTVYGVLEVVKARKWTEPTDRDSPYNISCANNHRWWAYKAPVIEIYNYYQHKKCETFDMELSSFINKSAKEDYEIKTIVGSKRLKVPGEEVGTLFTSRGVLRKDNGEPNSLLYMRLPNRMEYLEHLLLNVIYSQYATRHLKLSGTAELLPDFSLYTDQAADGRYILLSEVQNLMEDESKISMVQLSPETYTGVKYEGE